MKEFESVLDAMRFIKSKLPKTKGMERLYLMRNSFSGECFVSENTSELESAIEKDWYNGSCEVDPETHAEEFKVWSYGLAKYKEEYPFLYREYKPSVLSKDHIRGTANVDGRVMAVFSVSSF